MQNTLDIFYDRKKEIEFYFSILLEMNIGSKNIITIDNNKFFKILKSNFILMLYNLVEACIVNGMLEIYENLKNNSCTYDSVINEIKTIWANNKIAEIYGPTTNRTTYENRVKSIINDITNNNPIILTKNALDISGNLDAKKIKSLCDKHKIRYSAKDKSASLEMVKNKRNDLAHGDVSFSDCARDLPTDELEKIKDEVFNFLDGILNGMKLYYDDKQYMLQA